MAVIMDFIYVVLKLSCRKKRVKFASKKHVFSLCVFPKSIAHRGLSWLSHYQTHVLIFFFFFFFFFFYLFHFPPPSPYCRWFWFLWFLFIFLLFFHYLIHFFLYFFFFFFFLSFLSFSLSPSIPILSMILNYVVADYRFFKVI